jgi:hypothetical protein
MAAKDSQSREDCSLTGQLESVPAAYGRLGEMLDVLARDPENFQPPPPYDERQVEDFATFGSVVATRDAPIERIEAVRRWIKNVAGGIGPRAVFMDTTTIAGLESTLIPAEDHHLTPETLLDLSNFVTSFVLHDQIFHLRNSSVDSAELNELLNSGPVFVDIPVDIFDLDGPGGVLSALWDTSRQVREELRRPSGFYSRRVSSEEIDHVTRTWEEVLGVGRGELDLLNFDYTGTYDSQGPQLIARLLETTEDAITVSNYKRIYEDLKEKASFVSGISSLIGECHQRYLFNKLFSQSISLQYVPNAFRAPFQDWLYFRSSVVSQHLALAKYVDHEYREIIAERLKISPTKLVVPLFLSTVLARVSNLSEIPEVLADLRLRARPLRERLSDLDKAIAKGDLNEIEGLRNALTGEAVRLTELIQPAALAGAIAAMVPMLSEHPTPAFITAAMLLTYASQYPRDTIEKLKSRLLHPERRFLISTAQVASSITNLGSKVAMLWGVKEAYADWTVQSMGRLERHC